MAYARRCGGSFGSSDVAALWPNEAEDDPMRARARMSEVLRELERAGELTEVTRDDGIRYELSARTEADELLRWAPIGELKVAWTKVRVPVLVNSAGVLRFRLPRAGGGDALQNFDVPLLTLLELVRRGEKASARPQGIEGRADCPDEGPGRLHRDADLNHDSPAGKEEA